MDSEHTVPSEVDIRLAALSREINSIFVADCEKFRLLHELMLVIDRSPDPLTDVVAGVVVQAAEDLALTFGMSHEDFDAFCISRDEWLT